MEFTQFAKSGKCARGLLDKPVPKEVVDDIIETAKWATPMTVFPRMMCTLNVRTTLTFSANLGFQDRKLSAWEIASRV